jgi:hypothetical protein
MSPKTGIDRQQTGLMLSFVTLFAGITGFFYQFMADGTFMTFFVCVIAILELVESSKKFDERDNQLLLQSYGTAFIYLFFVVLIAYLFVMFSGILHIAGSIIDLINSHWIGSIAAIMCMLIGFMGVRNFKEIK